MEWPKRGVPAGGGRLQCKLFLGVGVGGSSGQLMERVMCGMCEGGRVEICVGALIIISLYVAGIRRLDKILMIKLMFKLILSSYLGQELKFMLKDN